MIINHLCFRFCGIKTGCFLVQLCYKYHFFNRFGCMLHFAEGCVELSGTKTCTIFQISNDDKSLANNFFIYGQRKHKTLPLFVSPMAIKFDFLPPLCCLYYVFTVSQRLLHPTNVHLKNMGYRSLAFVKKKLRQDSICTLYHSVNARPSSSRVYSSSMFSILTSKNAVYWVAGAYWPCHETKL